MCSAFNITPGQLRGAGCQAVDPGIDVPAVGERRPAALGLSALLSTTMLIMKEVMAALKNAGLRDELKVLIGGEAVTGQYADQIGADGYTDNAYGAVMALKQ